MFFMFLLQEIYQQASKLLHNIRLPILAKKNISFEFYKLNNKNLLCTERWATFPNLNIYSFPLFVRFHGNYVGSFQQIVTFSFWLGSFVMKHI